MDVARRVLETKVNRVPKVQPLKDKEIEPVAILNREHVMIHKITGILEVVANMLGEGRPLPKKLLTWGTSAAFMLNWQLHEEKELFYIDLFVERAQDVHGRTTQLYSRSSLVQIMEEHELIKMLLVDMQSAAKAYDIENRATGLKLRDIIMRYLPLIRFHAAREEDVFLPFSQRYLTADDVRRILADFERVESEVGKETIDARMETVEQLERILKIREKAV
jgi:hemerythrin-like domain-containing protein